ncbi:RE1-silencing transcription factor-like [Anoplophora glabripennis]|uniref:RE1-silencing transcription factor-like n=1 Tax=Anoplophora glabripennis TaxID=217634 RepID=UPI000C770D68|nr:RE1-silencing transcription factor-like [Anoplophora glabripennis]
MTGVRETHCRLCLKIIADKSFEVINNVIRDILDVLLLKLKLDDVTKEVICSVCKSKLYAALDFKSACLNTDNIIIPYVDCEKMLQLDLREVYRKEKRDESISENQKICRLCMQLVTSEFRCIREEELEAIQKLTPEMNINIIIDPVVCKVCLDSLCTHNSFCRECLEVEENFKGSSDGQATESQVGTSPSNLFVKTENLDREFDINEMGMSIKAEIVDIKSENEERSDEPLESPDNKPFEKSDPKVAKDDGYKRENRSTSKYNKKKKQERNELYRCDKCSYKTGSKIRFAAHCARCGKDSEVYKCKTCVYTTEHEKLFQRHQFRHKYPSQIQMYRCNDCDYETKKKSNINQHQLTHKDASQVQLYKCNECDYKTKYRYYCIKQHQLMHKDPSQVQMYRCNDCDFETKYRNLIRRHQLKHKDPSQVQMYRCNKCDYETKYKDNLRKHQLKHKDSSEVQMYRCNDCDYETKYRSHIIRHQVIHKDPSQVQFFKCNDCDYETKYRSGITCHVLTHRKPS